MVDRRRMALAARSLRRLLRRLLPPGLLVFVLIAAVVLLVTVGGPDYVPFAAALLVVGFGAFLLLITAEWADEAGMRQSEQARRERELALTEDLSRITSRGVPWKR